MGNDKGKNPACVNDQNNLEERRVQTLAHDSFKLLP